MKIQIERYNNNDDHVVVVEILGLNGKQVCEGDVLFLVETSKAVEDVLAPVGGIIKHNINLNDQLKVGVDCCEIVSESDIAFWLTVPYIHPFLICSIAFFLIFFAV